MVQSRSSKRNKVTLLNRFMLLFSLFITFSLAAPVKAEFSFQKPKSTSSFAAFADESEPEFLAVHDAFKTTLTMDGNNIIAQWQIADNYYMYRERFKFSVKNPELTTLGTPVFDHDGKVKHDEAFGDVEVYTHQVTVTIPIEKQLGNELEFIAKFQGCADAGLCYPPTKFKQLFVNLPQQENSQTVISASSSISTPIAIKPSQTQTKKISPVSPVFNSSATSDSVQSGAKDLVKILQEASLFGVIGICLLIGLGLTFTPCILPMIPILSSIIVGQNEKISTSKGFILSTTYVIGMASTYAAIGIIFALSGERIVIYMQKPFVLFTFAGIFILLALSMFGFYELQLPEKIRSKLDGVNQKQKSGTLIGVFVMGILAALLASPCVSAPLALVLVFISTSNDVVLGGVALFSIGLGIGLPLIIMGTTGSNILPKAGAWMETVKAFFGILMLALAAYFIKHLLPGTLMMMIWAALLIIPAIYMGAMQTLETNASGWAKLWKGLGVIMLIYGAMLIVGAASGESNPLQPINTGSVSSSNHMSQQRLQFTTVTSDRELSEQLLQATLKKRPVMLDYYADWCISCIEMEHGAFKDPEVVQLLSSHHLIQVDLTDTEDANLLLDRYELIGPPSILFFDQNGKEIRTARIVGEMDIPSFTNHLKKNITL